MPGSAPRLGLVLDDDIALRRGRRGDPVELVILRQTLVDPPRTAAAKALGERIRRLYPRVEIIPYAWHLVSHSPDDGLRELGGRRLGGAPERYGGLQATAEVSRAWDTTKRCAVALGAHRVALRTTASLSPGAAGRRTLETFVAGRRDEAIELVWEPQGVWTPDAIRAVSAEQHLAVLTPGFEAGRPVKDPPGRWLRVDGAGPRRGLNAGQLDELQELAEEADVVVFAGPRAHSNLRRFARLPEDGR